MRWIVYGLGVLMILLGAVWLLQGIGVLPGSFMTGQAVWAVIGLILVVLGAVLIFLRTRRRPSEPQA